MFKLASSIGFALALADLRQRIRRKVTQGILGAIGGVVFLFGFGFLLLALHLWLSRLLNPLASAAIIGGALIVIALVIFLVTPLFGKRRLATHSQPVSPFADAARSGMAKLSDAVGSEDSVLKNPALQFAGLALLVGFLLGRKRKSDKD